MNGGILIDQGWPVVAEDEHGWLALMFGVVDSDEVREAGVGLCRTLRDSGVDEPQVVVVFQPRAVVVSFPRALVSPPDDDPTRFLLDGLAVDSLADLNDLVRYGRWWLDECGPEDHPARRPR